MYALAHLGLGYALVECWPQARRRHLPKIPLLIGTVLPDLMDKPLFYGLKYGSLKFGDLAAASNFIAGTRTFGHTILFGTVLLLLAWWRHKEFLWALFFGWLTHVALDQISDLIISKGRTWDTSSLFWPLAGPFPETPFRDLWQQMRFSAEPLPLVFEIVGAGIVITIGIRALRSRSRL